MNTKSNIATPRILLVGVSYELPGTDRDEFYTDKHFLDYDIVIIDPLGALRGQRHDYRYDIHMPTGEDGRAFLDSYQKITRKLASFANKGGLAIVFLRPMPTLRWPGRRVSLEESLPWGENRIHRAHGRSIKFTSQGPIGRFWEATNGLWNYEAVYNDPPEGPRLAHVRGHSDEVVASLLETKERGFVIMTPVPSFAEIRGDKGVVETRKQEFVQAISSLHEALQTEGAAPQLPDWAGSYSLPGEMELRDEISAANEKIKALQKQVRERTKALDDLCLHKLLVTGHDSVLEGAVDRVLTDLGLEVQPGPRGRVDRTATYGDRKFAVEVQGVRRGAKEDHARALTIWVQEVAIEDHKEPKGLLVVNSYRDTPLAERDGRNLWPGETIKICERQGYCAMSGLQLLGLYLEAMADGTKREQLIERIFNTQGLFEGYEDWRQFLASIEG